MNTVKITEELCEQLLSHKFDNLDELNQILETLNLLKLNKKQSK